MVKVLSIDCGSSKFPLILSALRTNGASAIPVKPEDPSVSNLVFDAVLISGSPFLITRNENPPLSHFSWIRELDKPVLGICFGHQVLGMLHGARVFLGDPVRESVPVRWHGQDPLRGTLPSPTPFDEDHTEGITVPDGFIHLASSSSYSNEAMKHRELPHYGVQFHPETSGDHGLQLIGNFLEIVRGRMQVDQVKKM